MLDSFAQINHGEERRKGANDCASSTSASSPETRPAQRRPRHSSPRSDQQRRAQDVRKALPRVQGVSRDSATRPLPRFRDRQPDGPRLRSAMGAHLRVLEKPVPWDDEEFIWRPRTLMWTMSPDSGEALDRTAKRMCLSLERHTHLQPLVRELHVFGQHGYGSVAKAIERVNQLTRRRRKHLSRSGSSSWTTATATPCRCETSRSSARMCEPHTAFSTTSRPWRV